MVAVSCICPILANITWGEKMRPGQELSWTQLSINQNGATKNNMIVGVLNSTFNGYTHGFRFDRFSNVKPQSEQDSGVTVQSGITTTTAGQSCRLKYDYGDNKLKLEVVRSGVRETLAVSDSALDGNPIFISIGGDSTRMPTSTQGVQCMVGRLLTNHLVTTILGTTGELVVSLRILTFQLVLHLLVMFLHGKQTRYGDTRMVWQQDIRCIGLTPATHPNGQIGVWSSSNASSGLSNLENVDTYWDWSWQHNTSEEIDALKGWTFNTSNSNYSGVLKWD